jgi:hypothetical protein
MKKLQKFWQDMSMKNRGQTLEIKKSNFNVTGNLMMEEMLSI